MIDKFAEIVGETASLFVCMMARRALCDGQLPIEDLVSPGAFPTRYGKKQYAAAMAVPWKWMERPVEYIVRDALSPLIAALCDKIPHGTKMSGCDLELPKGLDRTALGRCAGISIRGICMELHIKGPSSATWLKTKRLYEISTDEFVSGPASAVLRFDVVEHDPAHNVSAISERSYQGIALARALRLT